jgi:hypothetical protein
MYIIFYYTKLANQDSSVAIVTDYELDGIRNGIRLQARTEVFRFSTVPTSAYEAHLASYLVSIAISFHGNKAAGAEADHSLSSRDKELYLRSPIYRGAYLIKYRENFIFYYIKCNNHKCNDS